MTATSAHVPACVSSDLPHHAQRPFPHVVSSDGVTVGLDMADAGAGADSASSARIAAGRDQRRISALEVWLRGQVELESIPVVLPRSGRTYAIRVPSEASRDQMFADAMASPGQPLPFWSRIWSSGVALGDLVLERGESLAGQQVLELGSGLGVTAAAAMEVGAKLLASDYTPLSLAFCRYNALANTGRSPRTLCVNWRRPTTQATIRADSFNGFPIILAADVLYESPDINPLIELIDRLLAPDGTLWLAEPGRKTADRFLNTVALAGWRGESFYNSGPWPDGSTTRVGIHLLQRPSSTDGLLGGLGGWRT